MTIGEKVNEMENLTEKVVKISQALLAWLVFVILSPVFLFTFGSLLIWKYGVVWIIVKLFKRKFIRSFNDSETFFAVDRFWESSHSSLGLIVELEGTINVDEFRDEFRKHVLEYPNHSTLQQNDQSNSENGKPFSKLIQIPSTFCGYYFWQKANYFLIHEHIRQINQPTDEPALRKAVGTLMTLPFPNRRPLWEILVYSNYLGTPTIGRGSTTCGSVLFIRVHRSVTDSQGLMNILSQMLLTENERANLLVKSVHVNGSGTTSSAEDPLKNKESEAERTEISQILSNSRYLMQKKFSNLVYFPLRSFHFARSVVKTQEGIVTCATESPESSNDSSYAGWTNLSEIMVWKTCASQSPKLTRSTVELCLFLEGLTSRGRRHKCFDVPEEKGVPAHPGKCKTSILVPLRKKVPHTSYNELPELLPNEGHFLCLKCPCIASSILQAGLNKGSVLKTIHDQLETVRPDHSRIVSMYLRMLSLLPRHLLRYLVMSCRWGAGYLLYEQFQLDTSRTQTDDPRVFGQQVVSQVVPLLGLQWPHTIASTASLKWQDRPNVVMSVIANPSIVGPLSQGNPQDQIERIVRGIPEELERLGDDEEHGFVSIPIS